MRGITLMTVRGIKDGTVGVEKRVRGSICPPENLSNIASNPGAYTGVKAGGVIETHISHD